MNKDKIIILDSYIKSGVSPILIENVPSKIFNGTILKANCDISMLNGHYENIDFVAPKWYQNLIKMRVPLLIIENINLISLDEQAKFIELLKYKKISTFDLPKNCLIIVTTTNLKENPLNEEVYSLMAHII